MTVAGTPDRGAAQLADAEINRLLEGVEQAAAAHRRDRPGRPSRRHPVQVLYVPADRVTATTATDAGREARRLLDAYAPDPAELADVIGLDDLDLAELVRGRVAAKLATEPVEDLRVDFEDGYLGFDDADEDEHAEQAARAVAAAASEEALPPFVGLRVKSFADGLARRSVATLDRFLGVLLEQAGELPAGFVVTLPKIVATDHVAAFAGVLTALEEAHGLPPGRLRFEVQIETAASVLAPDGRVALPGIRDAADGRLCGAHFGVYDYTASLGLPPAEQRLDHPACDFARHLMQVAFAGTDVALSDGSTNVVPAADTRQELHRVWRRHAVDVRHSLRHGYRQGWDLHPSHLVSRYTVVFAWLLVGMEDTLERLRRWREGTTGTSGVLDEPATVRMLEERVRQARDCGALDAGDALGTRSVADAG